MECFGKYKAGKVTCNNCEYRESCELCEDLDKRWGESERHWRWRRSPTELRDSGEAVIDNFEDLIKQETFTRADLIEVVNVVMRASSNPWLTKVIKDRLNRASFADIGKKEGITRQAVHNRVAATLAKILGFQQRKDKKKNINMKKISHLHLRIVHLRKNGGTYREISKKLSCSQKTIRKALNEAKIK